MQASFPLQIRTGFRELWQARISLRRLSLPYGGTAAALLLILGLAMACSRSPLLGTLGYESSALTALALALLLPFAFAHRIADLKEDLRRHPLRDERFPVTTEGRALGWLLAAWTLALLPGLVLLAAAALWRSLPRLLMRNCDTGEGLLWYAGIPLVTVALLLGITAAVMTLARSGRSGGWWVSGWVLGSLALSFVHWILGPRVAFLQPVLGAVVLPNYSPVVNMDLAFWISRLLAFHWGLGGWLLFLLAWHPKRGSFDLRYAFHWDHTTAWRLARSVHGTAILVLLAITWWHRGPLQLATPMSWLRRQLPAIHATQHFTIHYDPQSAVAAQITDLALLHEFHYEAIAQRLALTEPLVIQVWLYPTPQAKERLTGARGSVFAKPWINATHVYATGTDVSALRHELVHIMGREFGPPPAYVNLSPGLAEGIAEAVAWDGGTDLTIHQLAKGGRDLGLAPTVRQVLDVQGFFTGRLQLSYFTAGSFNRWLMDTYGIPKYRELFRHYSPFVPFPERQWQRFYDKPLDALVAEWTVYLDQQVPFGERERETIQFSYQQPAFVSQACARTVAGAAAKAQEAMALGLYDTALAEYRRLWGFQPGNLLHKLGELEALIAAERYDDALRFSADLLQAPNLTQALAVRLHGAIGDIHLRREEFPAARAAHQQALDLAVFNTQERDALIKLGLPDLPRPAARALTAGLTGKPDLALFHFALAQSATEAHDWIAPYLIARRLSMLGRYTEALAAHTDFLRAALPRSHLVPPAILREGLVVALQAAVWGHDLDAAAVLLQWIDDPAAGGTVPWSAADRVRLELSRDYLNFQQRRGVPRVAESHAAAWRQAQEPEPPLAPAGESGTAAPLGSPDTAPDPGTE